MKNDRIKKKEFVIKKKLIYRLDHHRKHLPVVEHRNHNENNNHSHLLLLLLDWMVHKSTENLIDNQDIENKMMHLD
jgi:hypothetical protein